LLEPRLELLKPHKLLFGGSRIKLPVLAASQKIKNKANVQDEP